MFSSLPSQYVYTHAYMFDSGEVYLLGVYPWAHNTRILLVRNIIGAMITLDVHARDIVTTMVKNEVRMSRMGADT